jgi:predicted DNA-binding antitoxin AbrB/MazE fold protein
MVIQTNATYENGILRPSGPLDLPDRSQVHVTIVPQQELAFEEPEEEVMPEPPLLTVEEFRRILSKGTVRAGTLPVDFDRDDIYSDHD